MTDLERLAALANAGYNISIATSQTVRNAKDVTLVLVSVEGNYNGEGLTLADALPIVFAAMAAKIGKRAAKDANLLAVLNG